MEPRPTPTFQALITQGRRKKRKRIGWAALTTLLLVILSVILAIVIVSFVMMQTLSSGDGDREGRESNIDGGSTSGFESGGGGGRVKFYQDIKNVQYEKQVLLMFGGENGSVYTFSDVDSIEVFMGEGSVNNLTCDPITPSQLFSGDKLDNTDPDIKDQGGSYSYKTGLLKQAILGSCLTKTVIGKEEKFVQCKAYDRYRKEWVAQKKGSDKSFSYASIHDPTVGITAGQLLLIQKSDGTFFAYDAYHNAVIQNISPNISVNLESCFVYQEDKERLVYSGGFKAEEQRSSVSKSVGALTVNGRKSTITTDDEVYPSLIYARRQHACGQFKTSSRSSEPLLIVAGGISEFGEATNTVEVLEVLKHDKWREVKPLNRKRWNYPSLGVIGGSLYIVGGRDGNAMGALNSIERYDKDLQKWVEDDTNKLSIPRTRHSGNFVSVDWCQNLDMEDEEEGDKKEEDGGRSFVFSSSSGDIK